MLLDFVQKNPNDPFPRYGLALEYRGAGRLEEAQATFTELLARHPDYTPAYLHAGNTLVARGLRDEARQVFVSGIEACRKKGDGHALDELEAALAAL
jgi:tetratricopeptide (TPR) repeat protein